MYKKMFVLIAIAVLALLGPTTALAEGPVTGLKWANHTAPFDFKFGNLIDNHQQTQKLPNGNLQGFIYVQFTGETINGIPVARRANCDDPTLDCRVGWNVIGVPIGGVSLLQKGPRIWRVDEGLLPINPGFVHFHWVGTPKKPCGLALNAPIYSGYLLKRTAVTTFYWLGGNDDKETGRLVTPGVDLHSNLEGLWTGGGGHDGGHDSGGDSGCGGHETGEEPGGEPGGPPDGDTGGCGGHETGEEPGGDTGCGGHETGGEPGG